MSKTVWVDLPWKEIMQTPEEWKLITEHLQLEMVQIMLTLVRVLSPLTRENSKFLPVILFQIKLLVEAERA